MRLAAHEAYATSPPSLRAARPLRRVRECHDCGLLLRLSPRPTPGFDAVCPRCDATLRRGREQPLTTAAALAIACVALLIVTLATPFLTLRLLGEVRASGIGAGVGGFALDGFPVVAVLLALTLMLLPALRIGLRLTVLLSLRARHPPRWLYRAFRLHERLGPWVMLEVFLFGALIAYTRLVDLAQVEIGPAAWGLGLLVLLLSAADATFAPQSVWSALAARGCVPQPTPMPPGAPLARASPIACHRCHLLSVAAEGAPCPRCGTALHRRKPASGARVAALVVAATILYLPANVFPVMTIISIGRGGPHTILGGVVEFVHAGFWPLAVIVFLASIAIPVLKLAGLLLLLRSVRKRATAKLPGRTRLYRFIEAIGRWSMIDVFVVGVLIGLVRFGDIASIEAELGIACFAAVVVLTMLAAEAFDPRRMWDAAGENGELAR